MQQENPSFIDAQAQAQEHPDTYWRVSEDVIDHAKPGDLAKVCTGHERFWVIVTSLAGDVFRGQISNYLHNTDQHGLKHGDFVSFERRHILDVDKQRVSVA